MRAAPAFSPGFSGVATKSGGLISPGLISPGFVSPGLVSPGLVSPGLVSPGLVSPGLVSPGLVSPGLVSPGFVSPGLRLRRPGRELLGVQLVELDLEIGDELLDVGAIRGVAFEVGAERADGEIVVPQLGLGLRATLKATLGCG